jgi:hypothetical protein
MTSMMLRGCHHPRAIASYNPVEVRQVLNAQCKARSNAAKNRVKAIKMLKQGTIRDLLNQDDSDEIGDWDGPLQLTSKDQSIITITWAAIADRCNSIFIEAFGAFTSNPRAYEHLHKVTVGHLIRKVIKVIGRCVDSVAKLRQLELYLDGVPCMRPIGVAKRTPEDTLLFREFGSHLIDAICKQCPHGDHPAVRVAWSSFYGIIVELMNSRELGRSEP